MVSTGMKCIKYVLFVFNLIFYMAGLLLIIAGALVQTKFQDYFVFFGGQFNGAAILLIVVGLIVFTVGFFGCCGAYKENHCMIMAFAVLLGIVFVLEVAAAITARVLQNELGDLVRKNMIETTSKYQQPTIQNVWDETQKSLRCCGSRNYTDWAKNDDFRKNSSVPDSCCKIPEKDCGNGMLNVQNATAIYQMGCADTMISWAEKNILIIGGVALGLAFIQIAGIIIACCLAAAIRKDYTPM